MFNEIKYFICTQITLIGSLVKIMNLNSKQTFLEVQYLQMSLALLVIKGKTCKVLQLDTQNTALIEPHYTIDIAILHQEKEIALASTFTSMLIQEYN